MSPFDILLDAGFINNGGGEVLLDFMIDYLSKTEINVFYFLDSRYRLKTDLRPGTYLFYKPSLSKRTALYLKYQHAAKKVFCFGNIPPPFALKLPVYTYFHQPLFISDTANNVGLDRFKLALKRAYLKRVSRNTDYWFVQTHTIKEGLAQKYKLSPDRIYQRPFYSKLPLRAVPAIRPPASFVYISSNAPHKNQLRLLDAFRAFYDRHHQGALHLTVDLRDRVFCSLVQKHQDDGYPVYNHGSLGRPAIADLLSQCRYLIFPSLAESFGLGLIEAIDAGCDVIAADLPYVYDVCLPSAVFDPYDRAAIAAAMDRCVAEALPATRPVIKDQFDELIALLKQ